MASSLTDSKPSNRQKLLNEAFGGLGQLTGEAQLRARRQAERNVQRAQEQKLNGRDFAARVTGRFIGEALAKVLGDGSDAELDRARLVDDAVEAAQKATGFTVPQAQVDQFKAEQAAEATQNAQAAAAQKTDSIQTTNAFEQQHLLITNTMQELTNRGLVSEAHALLPNLKALEEAEAEERMRAAELQGKELSNKDALDGDTKTIVPTATGEPLAAQIFSDGTARYWDEQAQAEVTLRPGQYAIGQLTGTRDDITDKEIKNVLPVLRGMTSTLGLVTDLRKEIALNPEARTVTSDVLSFVNRFINEREYKAIRRTLALENPEGFKDTSDAISTYLTNNNIDNARQKIMVERLAFALASARENGKLSVSDVEFAARAFGVNERDPKVRMALIDDIVKGLKTDYETIAAIQPDKLPSIPLYQRTGQFFDGYDKVQGANPVRPVGEPEEETDAEGTADFLFQTESGVTIR